MCPDLLLDVCLKLNISSITIVYRVFCYTGQNFISCRVRAMAVACARHILVNSEKKAQELKVLLERGKDFGELAKKHSTCPSGKKGGDLGEFRRGQMVKQFDDVVFKKEVLKIHGPVKTKFGFHLIQTIYRQ